MRSQIVNKERKDDRIKWALKINLRNSKRLIIRKRPEAKGKEKFSLRQWGSRKILLRTQAFLLTKLNSRDYTKIHICKTVGVCTC